MAKFRAPTGFGTPEQHVISLAEHLGYHYMVAYLVDNGFGREHIKIRCSDAAAEGAPKDAFARKGTTGWYQRQDIIDRRTCQRYDAYASALTQYQMELQRERNSR